jgi:hypothetical protein
VLLKTIEHEALGPDESAINVRVSPDISRFDIFKAAFQASAAFAKKA